MSKGLFRMTQQGIQARGLGLRHIDVDLYHPDLNSCAKYVEAVRVYSSTVRARCREGHGLLLTGPYGSGKTSIAVCIMKQAWIMDLEFQMVQAQEIASIYIDRPDWEGEITLDKRIEEVDLLTVDNLNLELSGKWVSEKFEALIRTRWNRKKATIITSNIPLDKFDTVVSKACAELIRNSCYPIVVQGKQWREPLTMEGLLGDE